VCGGGRYDTLIEQLGGKPAPAVGWGLGIERLLLLLQEAGIGAPAVAPDAYAVVPSPATMPIALRTLDALRAAGVSVLMHAAGRDGLGSMKSQFKRADASGARHALIFGDEEVARGEVAVKPLREASAAQHTRLLSDAALWADELRTA
jgi:histidyl-tRNA synthetase